MATPATLLISGFGIHMGGGLVLFKALLSASRNVLGHVLFDERFAPEEPLREDAREVGVERVRRSFAARIASLRRLAAVARREDVVLCFNSLPPLTRSRGFVVVFVHAPHFVGAHAQASYPPRVALRLAIERLWFRLGARHADEFWVQTSTMAAQLRRARPAAVVRVVPLVDDVLLALLRDRRAGAFSAVPAVDFGKHEFFFPADAVAHKNHPQLLRAWQLLDRQGKHPGLTLTLSDDEFHDIHVRAGLKVGDLPAVCNAGRLTRDAVLERLRRCSALVFPSFAETYGLPMLEAAALGVPIVASERDFVRDICQPRESFDPTSARSIARAIERFVEGGARTDPEPCGAQEFVGRLMAAAQTCRRRS